MRLASARHGRATTASRINFLITIKHYDKNKKQGNATTHRGGDGLSEQVVIIGLSSEEPSIEPTDDNEGT